MTPEIIVVSGLPRSGTSLVMQMLQRGGIEVVTDGHRAADIDNPRGYFEFEGAKSIKHDSSWLPAARGKAVKLVSQLLYDLPASEFYRVLFMDRDLDEVLKSQEKMLRRLNRPTAPVEHVRRSFQVHLARLHAWLQEQPHMNVLVVPFAELMQRPQGQAARIAEFLDGRPDSAAMAAAIDRTLYRNRALPATS